MSRRRFYSISNFNSLNLAQHTLRSNLSGTTTYYNVGKTSILHFTYVDYDWFAVLSTSFSLNSYQASLIQIMSKPLGLTDYIVDDSYSYGVPSFNGLYPSFVLFENTKFGLVELNNRYLIDNIGVEVYFIE